MHTTSLRSHIRASSPYHSAMRAHSSRYVIVGAVVAALLVSSAVGASAAPSPVVPIIIVGQPSAIVGVNQGLPPLSPTEDYDAGPALAPVIEAYRDSGQYQADQAAVAREAQEFLDEWMQEHCESPRRCDGKKPAAVFDIDDTLVDWYPTYQSMDFQAQSAVVSNAIVNCLTPAIVAVRKFLHHAQRRGVSVFLISGRPVVARQVTAACLNQLDISDWQWMYLRQPYQETLTAEQYKSSTRGIIEARGYKIITSIGDQLSDSTGGHVELGFRLPNPMYYIA